VAGVDRLYPLWAYLLRPGLRIGELVWLSWKHVDLERYCETTKLREAP
jgi:integrase